MNQVDKELMQEKGILTENEKADEYEIQKAAMKEAVFFLAAMLEKNLDMSELQTISLYLKELSMRRITVSALRSPGQIPLAQKSVGSKTIDLAAIRLAHVRA